MTASARGGVGLSYTPFGFVGTPPGTPPATGFAGERREAPMGGYLLGSGHRFYSPALMRFHSADRESPFLAGGINAYAYCLGDPVNMCDPSGHAPIRVGVARPQERVVQGPSLDGMPMRRPNGDSGLVHRPIGARQQSIVRPLNPPAQESVTRSVSAPVSEDLGMWNQATGSFEPRRPLPGAVMPATNGRIETVSMEDTSATRPRPTATVAPQVRQPAPGDIDEAPSMSVNLGMWNGSSFVPPSVTATSQRLRDANG
ncbi:RHS repeat-associated core domain-containing protein [Pseudomonas sp. CAM1A]|uniref:RHS repeat-associated core domain-containing protein n=1 Tax=Pseudomonas sp. CAM1A TaxID=3231717 RepID=UPI0039C66D6F